MDKTPLEYMQLRFRRGFDEETPIIRSEKLLSKKDAAVFFWGGVGGKCSFDSFVGFR